MKFQKASGFWKKCTSINITQPTEIAVYEQRESMRAKPAVCMHTKSSLLSAYAKLGLSY